MNRKQKAKKSILCAIIAAVAATAAIASGCAKEKTHEHVFESAWTAGENTHYHKCTAEGCEEKGSEAPHEWSEGEIISPTTETAAGKKRYVCAVCEGTKETLLPTYAQLEGYFEKLNRAGGTIVFDRKSYMGF